MNDAELENHLRGLLRPTSPSPDLHERIRAELQPSPTRQHAYSGKLAQPVKRWLLQVLLRDFGWACAGAAAALAVLALWPARVTSNGAKTSNAPQQETPSSTAEANTFEHDETTKELVSTQDTEQLVETDDGPAREVRYTYLEHHAWSNPTTGAHVYLEVPREDVYLVPVSLQ